MKTKVWKYIFGFLTLILILVSISLFQIPDNNLHIIACNVGQGDAILATYGSTQILTDGGPDNKVLDCLGRYVPFWDHEIELVISTHPDADHSSGLVSVLENYKVDKILINPINPGTSVYQALEKWVGSQGVDVINPSAGMELGVGLIHLDIVSPEESMYANLPIKNDGSILEKYSIDKETNLFSIVYELKFNKFIGIFTGDMSPEISDKLAATWQKGSVDYIKIPHHGSINGITENFLKAVNPKIAVISVGKNQWGLPKEEILNLLSKYNIKVHRTDQMGDIRLITDGKKYWFN